MPGGYVVGLTGGIGSGKSEVARAFAALGADTVDADDVAHALSQPHAAGHQAVVVAFGAQSLRPDGTLDRDWLRDRAFADAAFRGRLERTLHPLIAARIDDIISRWEGPYGILVVPLLIESGLDKRVARVLVVDCPEEMQVERVGARSGLAPATVRAIMATQKSREARRARADDIIDNSGSLADMHAQVGVLDRRYRDLAMQARETRQH